MLNVRVNLIAVLLCFLLSTAFAALPVKTPLIVYGSAQGQQMLMRSQYKADFWKLSEYFVTQKNLAFCVPASSAMVLNALGVKRPVSAIYNPYPFFTQKNIFTPKVLKVTKLAAINVKGMELDQAATMLNQFSDVKARAYHANQTTIKKFRRIAIKALSSGKVFVIVNVLRSAMYEVEGGHMSPLAAYDRKTDRLLFMDVSRYKYPPVWVKTQDLWNAMHTKDRKKYRGFIIVKKR